jgi:hypothetical protein
LTRAGETPELLVGVSELEQARDRTSRGDDSKDGNDK